MVQTLLGIKIKDKYNLFKHLTFYENNDIKVGFLDENSGLIGVDFVDYIYYPFWPLRKSEYHYEIEDTFMEIDPETGDILNYFKNPEYVTILKNVWQIQNEDNIGIYYFNLDGTSRPYFYTPRDIIYHLNDIVTSSIMKDKMNLATMIFMRRGFFTNSKCPLYLSNLYKLYYPIDNNDDCWDKINKIWSYMYNENLLRNKSQFE